MRYPKFKGWDWTEVTDYFHRSKKFNYSKPSRGQEEWHEYEDKLAKHFGEWALGNYKQRWMIVKICRSYLNKVVEVDPSYATPLWKGLYKIENDETFLGYFLFLLQCIWT